MVSTHADIFQPLCVWYGKGPVSVAAFFFLRSVFFLLSPLMAPDNASFQRGNARCAWGPQGGSWEQGELGLGAGQTERRGVSEGVMDGSKFRVVGK